MEKINHDIFEIGNQENPLISILLSLRSQKLPTSDELILHSAGPISDLSEYSFLPSLDSIRILFLEPEDNYNSSKTSALAGEISFKSPKAINMLIQEFKNNHWENITEYNPNTLKEAMDIVKEYELDTEIDRKLPIIPGGFVGMLGYDMNRWILPLHLDHTPQNGTLLGVLWRSDAWCAHERKKNKLHLITIQDHIWEKIKFPDFSEKIQFPDISEERVPDSESDSEHARKISQIKDSISKGNLYQVNYGRTWKGDMSDHPWNAFLRMKRSNPSPFSSWLFVHDYGWAVSSASPERLLKTDKNIVQTRPIKGTRARGLNSKLDNELRISMASSEKELAEHLMLVDLERHDISSICVPGSVHWSNWRIEALSTVQHLVSGVDGELSKHKDAGDALISLFPGGSITGCPKAAAISAINELERKSRSAWTGSIGHIHFKSNKSDWNILIRTLEAHYDHKSWHGIVQAGGGIVTESIPSEEVEEARWKAASITEAAWGFRTGFSSNELPERDVEIIPVPKVNGSLSNIKPSKRFISNNIGNIYRSLENPKIKQVLIIDNLDSFTENIATSLSVLGHNVRIVQGRPPVPDSKPSETINFWLKLFEPTHIIIGPGPAQPDKSKITMEISKMALHGSLKINDEFIPILGLCLGHQALGQAAGWDLITSPLGAVHGVPSIINHDGLGIYSGLKSPLILMRYNSLILKQNNTSLIPTAWDETSTLIMGLRHRSLPIYGIQFHPESVGSPMGIKLIENFISKSLLPI